MSSTYILKKLDQGRYSDFDDNLEGIIPRKISFVDDCLFTELNSFSDKYGELFLPNSVIRIVEELAKAYDLQNFKDELLTFIGASQEIFISSCDSANSSEPLMEDFTNEKLALEELLNLMQKYLFSNNRKWIHSIRFINDSPQENQLNIPEPYNIKLKNFFVVGEVYEAICKHFNLTKDNFTERSKILLGQVNQYDFSAADRDVKRRLVKTLNTFIYPQFMSKRNESLRFIGLFLNLAQIPYKHKNSDIEIDLQQGVDYNLQIIDFKNIQNILNRKVNTAI